MRGFSDTVMRRSMRATGGWLAGFAVAVSVAQAGDPINIVVNEWDYDYFPELFEWTPDPYPVPGERWIENGWYFQSLGPAWESSFFRTDIDRFMGVDGFFVEWRAVNDSPAWLAEELPVPAIMSVYGQAASTYRMTFADSAAVLWRDPLLPYVVAEISAGIPHIYRLEVYADEYIWYIDGIVVDSGVPEGPYPDANAGLGWGTRSNGIGAATTSAFDYIRYGRIPDDATGDIDSDFEADHVDTPYVMECLTREAPASPAAQQQGPMPVPARALDVASVTSTPMATSISSTWPSSRTSSTRTNPRGLAAPSAVWNPPPTHRSSADAPLADTDASHCLRLRRALRG